LITLESLKVEIDELRERVGGPIAQHGLGGVTPGAASVQAIRNEVAWLKPKAVGFKTDCLLLESDLDDVNREVIALKSLVAGMKQSLTAGELIAEQVDEALDQMIDHLVQVDFRLGRLLPRATSVHERMPRMERALGLIDRETKPLMHYFGIPEEV
jgi:hypothetical protein